MPGQTPSNRSPGSLGVTLYFEHNAERNSIRIAGHPPTNLAVVSTLQSEYWQMLSPRLFLALVELVLTHDRFTIDISCTR
jgi:hypothetical protein